MKWFKSWYIVIAVIWIIIVVVIWVKGEFIEMKTPLALVIYVGSAILALAGTSFTFIGIGQGIRKIAIILTNKTSLVSGIVERIGKWFLYADKNRDLPTGFYYLLLGLALLIGSSLLMGYLFNNLQF